MANLFDLGWVIARVGLNRLELVSPSDSSEGFYEPGSKIVLCRKQDIEELRKACDVALDPNKAQ